MFLSINGAPINSAPTSSNGSVTTDAGTDYVFQKSDFAFSDPDGSDTLASVTVETLPASGKGTLTFDGTALVSGDLPKTVTTDELDADKLEYSPPAGDSGDDFATFTFKVNDGTDDSASTYTMTIDVTDTSGSTPGESTIVDTTQALISNIGQRNADGSNSGHLAATAVDIAQKFTTGSQSAGYTLTSIQLTLDNQGATGGHTVRLMSGSADGTEVVRFGEPDPAVVSNLLQTHTFTPASATTLLPNTDYWVRIDQNNNSTVRITFINAAGYDGTPAAGFSMNDVLEYYLNGNFIDLTGGTGISRMLLGVNGAPINSAPTSSNGSVAADADTDYAFQESDFPFSDSDGSDTLASVMVETLPASGKGTLTFDGTALVSGDLPKTVTTDELDADKLVYSPPAGDSGDDFATFTFKVNDGTDDSASTYTMTIDVRAANDPASGNPTIAGTFQEGQTLTVSLTGIADTDGKTKADNGDAGYAYTYQWYRLDAGTESAIDGATASTYTVQDIDVGTKLRVDVSFTDDKGNAETVQSAESDVVTAMPAVLVLDSNGPPVVAKVIADQVAMVDTAFSFQFAADAFQSGKSGSLIYSARRYDGRSLPSWLTFAAATRTFSGTPQSGNTGRVSVKVTATDEDGLRISDTFDIVVGSQPSVSGTARVGQELSARTGSSGTFTYQWIRVDGTTETDISSATASTYTLDAADLGKKVKVKVSFSVSGSTRNATSDAYPRYAKVQPSTCGSASLTGRRQVWAGTLTVGARRAGPRTEMIGYGWRPGTGSLTRFDDAISLGTNSYRIGSQVLLYAASDALADLLAPMPGALVFGLIGAGDRRGLNGPVQELTATEKAALRLHVCDRTFDFSSATYLQPESYEWQAPDLFWAVGDAVPLTLSVPATFTTNSVSRSVGAKAKFTAVPKSHDGENSFQVDVQFSGEPWGLSPQRDAASVLEVTGGRVSEAREAPGDANPAWEVTIEPVGAGDVTVRVPARTCAETSAVCIDGKALGEAAETTVPGPQAETQTQTQPVESITARFTREADSHDGASAFLLHFQFSHEPRGLSAPTVQNALFDVEGGHIEKARRLVVRGKGRGWEIRVVPEGFGAVTLKARATTDCAASHAVCDAAGRRFDGALQSTVQGPPLLSVADAEVDEAEGATLDFVVTLSRALSQVVTVRYATSDGSATAGSDYAAASGVLTFAADDTSETVSVPVLDDAHNEGRETVTLTLSNPSPARVRLADAEAMGTIRNTDVMPQAWIGRFGRTVAVQAIEALEARLAAPREAGLSARVAGHEVSGPAPEDAGSRAAGREEGRRDIETLAGWLGGEAREGEGHAFGSRTLTRGEALGGLSFAWTGGTAATGSAGFWGRGAVTNFDGRDGQVEVEGEVMSAMMGADFSRGALLAGLMLSRSRGTGGYRAPSGNGEVDSTLTLVLPYGRYAVDDRVSVWTMAGYGEGRLALTPDGQALLRPDMELVMGAAGVRGVVVDGGEDDTTLTLKADALAVRTRTTAVSGARGKLAASQADVTRVRFALEGARPVSLSETAVLTPSLELGVRHDGGDAETGFGTDIGAGVSLSDPVRGLSAALRARTLLTHEDGGLKERGVTGTLSFDPTPASERGISLGLTQSVGAQASGGADALLERTTLAALGAEEEGGVSARHLDARLGYGFGVVDGRYTAIPELGFGLSDTDRELRLGWRLAERVVVGLALDLGIEGTRRERIDGTTGPAHGLVVGAGWRLAGAGAASFDARIEAARREPANDDAPPEDTIGVKLDARW